MKKTIITVVGNDTVGIIAKVCTYLANNNVNILDISQTIVQGYFNMMMVTDASKCEKDNGVLAKELEANCLHRQFCSILRSWSCLCCLLSEE